MSEHNDVVSLRQMLDYAREATGMAAGRTRVDIESDRMLQLALTRLVEVVGEGATRVSREAQLLYPDIPWPQIVSMRNRLIHGYDVVDWDTICDDLPPLISELERIVEAGER